MLCPSAQPETAGALAIGVVDHTGSKPEVAYLERPLVVSEELLRSTRPLRPTEVLRFAASCQTSACAHWNGAVCNLATRIVTMLPPATSTLPKCNIRHDCRWYAQEGRAACARCPQVVTQNEQPSEEMREAALPV